MPYSDGGKSQSPETNRVKVTASALGYCRTRVKSEFFVTSEAINLTLCNRNSIALAAD